MTVTRITHYRARAGAEEALHSALLEAVPVIANGDGCFKVRLLSSLDDPAEFILHEEWTSIDAHRAAASALPAVLFEKIGALTAAPPKGGYFAG